MRLRNRVQNDCVDGPAAVVLRDRPFQIAILLWSLAVLLVVYRGRELQTWSVVTFRHGGM
jgi:hypothetical protein